MTRNVLACIVTDRITEWNSNGRKGKRKEKKF